MKVFSMIGFSEHLLKIAAGEYFAMRAGLEIVAKAVTRTAKGEISHYQKSYGNFPAWAPLAESTLDEKMRLGYSPPDNPLLRTGELRASISYHIDELVAWVGSTSEIMIYHEFGTSKMPMRPVLGTAVFRNKKVIQKVIGTAVVSGFYGQMYKIHPSLGYDFEVTNDTEES